AGTGRRNLGHGSSRRLDPISCTPGRQKVTTRPGTFLLRPAPLRLKGNKQGNPGNPDHPAHPAVRRRPPVLTAPRGKTMKITHLHALRVRIPQKPPIAPYQSRYRAGTAKEALLVRLDTDNGLTGWGETPDDWINQSFVGAPEERLRSQVLGRDPH